MIRFVYFDLFIVEDDTTSGNTLLNVGVLWCPLERHVGISAGDTAVVVVIVVVSTLEQTDPVSGLGSVASGHAVPDHYLVSVHDITR